MGEAPYNADRSTTGPALAGMLCEGQWCNTNHFGVHCGRSPKLCAKCCRHTELEVDREPGHCLPKMSWYASNDLHLNPRLRGSGRSSGSGGQRY